METEKLRKENENKGKYERENPKLDNLSDKRMYSQTDKHKQSQYNDKIERAIKKLPDTNVGHNLYTSLQTMLLKGNDYS